MIRDYIEQFLKTRTTRYGVKKAYYGFDEYIEKHEVPLDEIDNHVDLYVDGLNGICVRTKQCYKAFLRKMVMWIYDKKGFKIHKHNELETNCGNKYLLKRDGSYTHIGVKE